MKEQLRALSREAMGLIGTLSAKGDAAAIARVAAAANRIKQLEEQLAHIEQEIPGIQETIQSCTPPVESHPPTPDPEEPLPPSRGGSGRKKLRIQVNWARLNKPGGKELICEHKASDTMTKFAVRLHQEFGLETLQKLCSVRISRGPMVSKTPRPDFVNQADETLYAHHPISDTGYYILTHSPNTQKVTDIQKACRSLGFPVGAVLVDEVDKEPPLATAY
jgi:hypothetical protein